MSYVSSFLEQQQQEGYPIQEIDPSLFMHMEGHPINPHHHDRSLMGVAQDQLSSSSAFGKTVSGPQINSQSMGLLYKGEQERSMHAPHVSFVDEFIQGGHHDMMHHHQFQGEDEYGQWDQIYGGGNGQGRTFVDDWEEQQMSEIYDGIQVKEQWADDFQSGEGWQELAMRANMIDDPGLQSSEFMGFIRGLQALSGVNTDVWADDFQETMKEEEKIESTEWNNIWNNNQRIRKDDQNYELNADLEVEGNIDLAKNLFDSGKLAEAITELESYLLKNPTDDQAWKLLGRVQAENDNDTLAIQALNNAIELNPSDLDTLILLGVSHTNNFNTREVYEVFLQWIHQNPVYADLAERYPVVLQNKRERDNHKAVSDLFIRAAKLNPGKDSDPDVHIALGVLYNLNFEYDKAKFCFTEALKKRPDDYQLWNKLGATLANAQQNEEAADSYIRALEKKPEYTRSRSNLGLAYMSLRDYASAAECFLGAITINNTDHLWRSVNTSFTLMRRPDLVDMARNRDVELFRDEFNF